MLGFDRTFKAMSDPTRRAILRVLTAGARNAGQIKSEIGVAANALSFHLRILKDADLVRDRRRGQFIEYELNTTVMDDMIRFLMDNFGRGNGVDLAADAPAAAQSELDRAPRDGAGCGSAASDASSLSHEPPNEAKNSKASD